MLNEECASLARQSRRTFAQVIRRTLKGGTYAGVTWDRLIEDDDNDNDSPESLLDDEGDEELTSLATATGSAAAPSPSGSSAATAMNAAAGNDAGGSKSATSSVGSSDEKDARPPTSNRRPLLKGQRYIIRFFQSLSAALFLFVAFIIGFVLCAF